MNLPIRRPRPNRHVGGLGDSLHRTFRTLLIGVGLVTLVLAGLSWWIFAHLHPRIAADVDALHDLRETHTTVTDQRMALAGWLARGDRGQLARARVAERRGQAALDALVDDLGRSPELDRAILELHLTHQAWSIGWADPVAQLEPGDLTAEERRSLLGADDEAFARYRRAHEVAVAVAVAGQDDGLAIERTVIAAGLGGVGTIALAMALLARRARRRLEGSVAEPLARVRAAMDGLVDGQRPQLADLDGPEELIELAAGLERTADRLLADQEELVEERERTRRHAATMGTILDVAREIAGSLNVRYVAESLAEAAHRISTAGRVVVWLTDRSELVAVHDSTLPRGTVPELPHIPIGETGVGAIARDARPEPLAGVAPGYGFPLVVGGRVVGVLELADAVEGFSTEELEPLESLAVHGAAALEAARLHRAAEDLAQVDALTELPNRRRLDDDLEVEVERSLRYGRPLSLLMVDLDHFKQLNDTYGHQHGDEVLRAVAATLREGVRSSDTAYRYGGEEFCVLVREGDAAAAAELAERLRSELAGTFAVREGHARVTASIGVASVPQDAASATQLVAAADQALYAAKRAGRDRVVTVTSVGAADVVAV